MAGSNIFKILIKKQSPEEFMRPVLLVSAVALSVPVLLEGVNKRIDFRIFNFV